MDGYRRLERTRSAAGAALGAATVDAGIRRSPRLTRARVAGALRLVGFVGVLALIVGTSVSLASADERGEPTTRAAEAKVVEPTPVDTTPVADTVPVADTARESRASTSDEPAMAEATDDVVETAADAAPAADAVAVDASATAGTASGVVPQAALPLTGDLQIRWLLLGGATLVLFGMLVQVAGQPLPARARSRS